MDRFIARQNIDHFRRQLATARDPAERAQLEKLLAEAQEELRRAEASHAADGHSAAHPILRPSGGSTSERRPHDEGARRMVISEVVEQLQLEIDPGQRHSLRQRLIEEEDRFGLIAQRLDLADGHIEDGLRRIEQLELQAARLSGDGDSNERLATILNNSRDILEIFRSYRASLADAAGRIDL